MTSTICTTILEGAKKRAMEGTCNSMDLCIELASLYIKETSDYILSLIDQIYNNIIRNNI